MPDEVHAPVPPASGGPVNGLPSHSPVPVRPRNTWEWIQSYFRTIPFSFLMAAVIVTASVFAGSLLGQDSRAITGQWGLGVDSTFLSGRWWTPLTALFLPQDPLSTVVAVGGAILLLGLAERTLGTGKAMLAFLVTGILGGVLGVLLQWVGTLTWEWWSTGTSMALTVDPMTGLMGALSTATAAMGLLWRRRIRVILFTYVLIFFLYSGDPEDLYRLTAVLVGLPLGLLIAARHSHPLHVPRSSHRETRTLVAAVVLVTGLGPLVAFLGSTDLTPFAFGSYLFLNDPVDPSTILAACQGEVPLTHQCVRQLARIGSQGPGMVVMAFLPLVLVIVAAWGLYRGRRFGWWLAVSVNAAILLFAPSSFGVVRAISDAGTHLHRPFSGTELIVWVVTAALVPLASLVMLFITRRHFGIRAPKSAIRRFWLIVVIAFVVTSAVYLITAMADMRSILPLTNPGRLLLDTPRRFLPPHFVVGPTHVVLPRHSPVSWAYQWSGPVFWAVTLGTMVWLLTRSPRLDEAHDVERSRELLHRFGGGSLGHMTTWEGNTPWLRRDGDAALAYRVVSDTAIVLGDPVCAPGEARETVHQFLEFCDEHNWTPAFYSFHPDYVEVFEGLGWRTMSVGEETVVHTPDFSLKGKHWQSIRTSLNKAVREGRTTVWTSWAELSFAATTEIVAISEAWMAENRLPEMGFTLGGVDELKDPDVRLMLALDADGRIEAVTSWMPIQDAGETVGWTLDFMRRSPESSNGVMEFLIASSALYMQEQGFRYMSLSGAPLATKPLAPGEEAEPAGAGVDAFLGWLSRTLEPAYGFSSLFRFKAKFHPEYVTLYMAYPDALSLPGIGVSLARAYLPDVSTRETVALARMLGRKD
ncbi:MULTISPECIES: phosphatidylglycerol lysyltransferase domain-containing protein [Arthrobacter]|uniref:Phosphatidylglycerol lysyltransferase domain-containing protein n=2 Tax=Arthrobacter TaxID=1663 RepID=A0ABU9KLD9_9MICC|nr:phosphatidylglycerol lysyltransferase domain-containing protein [Arthrobacter sp. YJM1]MDP5227663.1 phosphatidylglycerol lysyltransferase domain-containing protein [Arthrobacter sp. YJM1]